jgi:hypothetical protein
METDRPVPEGSLGNADAAEALAARLEGGCGKSLRSHLIHFAVRVGARRAADAATSLTSAGFRKAAAIADEQARLIGALQYPLVVRNDRMAAETLRRLAPTYDRLLSALHAGG